MGPSSTWGHNPKLIACPCLNHWVKSQTALSCSLSCQDWMIWEAPGHLVAQPSAIRPNKKVHSDLESTTKWFLWWCFAIVFTCAGVRSQLFATSKTTGSESSSPFPKEEYAWKQTPNSLQTLLSSVWHSCGWNSTWRERPMTFSITNLAIVLAFVLYCVQIAVTLPVAEQEEFCSSALVLSCV